MFSVSDGNAAIVENMWTAWSRGDKAGVLVHISDDVRSAVHIPQETTPFGGETFGKAAFSDRLQTILDIFDLLRYEANVLAVSGAVVRGQAHFAFRHKLTGEVLEGVVRLVLRLADDLVVEADAYHDVERIKAFMRLVAFSAQK